MNCENCGAPMVLFREQEYFRCEHCGSYHLPSASKDGVRALGKAPGDLTCPVCGKALLVAALDGRYQGYQCESCQGLLLQRPAFAATVETRRRGIRVCCMQPPSSVRTG